MRSTRRYFGCCTNRCTSTTMVFSIFALVTLPVSTVRLPRLVSTAASVSVVITPYLPSPVLLRRPIPVRAKEFSPAPDPSLLRGGASELPPVRCSAESATEKSVRSSPSRAPPTRLRLLRESFQYDAAFLQSSRARHEFRGNRQLVSREVQRLPRRGFVDTRHFKHD